MSEPCPVCELPYGFHDVDDPAGRHAAARALIPAVLRRQGNKAARRERQAAASDEQRPEGTDG